MIIPESYDTLADGRQITLRSPKEEEGLQLLNHMKITSGESYFLVRYPEEFRQEESFMRQRIKTVNNSKEEFMISAFLDGEMVGNIGLQKIQYSKKYMHRAEFGISVQSRVSNMGIGHILMEKMLNYARETSVEQIELGVFADNEKAKHLYLKMGFVETGVHPRAFKLKDGTYRDEIMMMKIL